MGPASAHPPPLSPADVERCLAEAAEELGLEVRVTGLVAVVHFLGREQRYFLARSVGGTFGTGDGPEMNSPADSASGSHRAVWLPTDSLLAADLRPRPLAGRLQESASPSSWQTLLTAPLVIHVSLADG